ncbi:hypothetical protein HmCmsJML283_03214 [Escherichia coli]|nr:hypothetical protein HmCmsJML283_03214 [Escherichia coli]
MSTRAVTIVIAKRCCPITHLAMDGVGKTVNFHHPINIGTVLMLPTGISPQGIAIDITFAAAIKTNIRMRVTKDQAANCTAFFTGETAIDTERQARQCLLKTSSRISGHVIAGVNCRTPHRRIVTNAFYATKTLTHGVQFCIKYQRLCGRHIQHISG